MRYNISLAVVTALSLLACGEQNPTQSPAIQKKESTAAPASTEQNRQKKPVKRPAAEAIKPAAKPLDLTLPETEQNNFDSDTDFTNKDSMENLFIKHKKESLMSIDGKLLQNKEIPNYIDSIEGAELSIKVKTK